MVSYIAYAARALRPYPTFYFGNPPHPPKVKLLPFRKFYPDRRIQTMQSQSHVSELSAIHSVIAPRWIIGPRWMLAIHY